MMRWSSDGLEGVGDITPSNDLPETPYPIMPMMSQPNVFESSVNPFDLHLVLDTDITSDVATNIINTIRRFQDKITKEVDKFQHSFHQLNGKGEITWPGVHLHIESYGGLVSSGVRVADFISTCETPVFTHIEGIAASAATVISVCGKQRTMTKNSMLMIHSVSTWFSGDYEDFQDEGTALEMIMEQLVGFYKRHTKMKKKQIQKLLKRNTYFNAEQALELGFIDEIV